VRVLELSCEGIPQLFTGLLNHRYDLTPAPQLRHEFPISSAWQLLEEKTNRDNWNSEEGYYRVGCGENRYQDFQPGWTGGLMNTHALLHEGTSLSRERAKSTLDFVFTQGGQGNSGFFHGTYHKGQWAGDGFDIDPWTAQERPHPERNHYHLLRKSADALYFVLRQFDLLSRQEPGWQAPAAWVKGAQNCTDAFVRLWRRYGQLGQFVDIHSGDIIVGGSSSAAMAPAALALASQWFAQPEYLEVAQEIATHFLHDYTQRGITTGGPGEILQCPDSESAAALLESYIVLWEYTSSPSWLEAAEQAAAQLATWQMPYDYAFPPDSEFGRLGLLSTGSVFANSQNGHSAPGICTLSGNAYLKLFRATGKPLYMQLLHELAHNHTQYLSREDRPIKDPSGRALPTGWINERVNTSDWDNNVGGVFYGGTWAEVSMMLTAMEVPGIYLRRDTGLFYALDHVDVKVENAGATEKRVTVSNPTNFPARVKLLLEDAAMAQQPLGQNYLWNAPTLELAPGESQTLSV
jgi:hypothetical protein